MGTAQRSFDVEPPPQMAVLMLGATAALPLVAVLGLFVVVARDVARPDLTAAVATALSASALTALFVALTLRRRAIDLTSTHLVVKAGLFTRRVPIARLDIGAARISMLGEQADSRAGFKLLGVGLPGYRTGWFMMRDGGRAFLMTTSGPTLRLPVRDAAPLLLTPAQPDTLLAALRDVAGARPAR